MSKIETKVSVKVAFVSGEVEDISVNGLKDGDAVAGAFVRSKFVKTVQVVCTHENTSLAVINGGDNGN